MLISDEQAQINLTLMRKTQSSPSKVFGQQGKRQQDRDWSEGTDISGNMKNGFGNNHGNPVKCSPQKQPMAKFCSQKTGSSIQNVHKRLIEYQGSQSKQRNTKMMSQSPTKMPAKTG